MDFGDCQSEFEVAIGASEIFWLLFLNISGFYNLINNRKLQFFVGFRGWFRFGLEGFGVEAGSNTITFVHIQY